MEARRNSSTSSNSEIEDFDSFYSNFIAERSGTCFNGTEIEGYEWEIPFSAAQVDFDSSKPELDDPVLPDVLVERRQSDSSYAMEIADSLKVSLPSESSFIVTQVVDSFIPEFGLPFLEDVLWHSNSSSSTSHIVEDSQSLFPVGLVEQPSTCFSDTGGDSLIVEPVNDRISADLSVELASRMSSIAAGMEDVVDSIISNVLSPAVESTSTPSLGATELNDLALFLEEVTPPIEVTISATEEQLQEPPPTTPEVECAKVERVDVQTAKSARVKRCAVPKATVIKKVHAAPAQKSAVEFSVGADGVHAYTIIPPVPQPLPKSESASKGRLESPASCEASTEPPAKKRTTNETKLPEMRNVSSAPFDPPAKKRAAETSAKKLTPIQKACQVFFRNALRANERRRGPR